MNRIWEQLEYNKQYKWGGESNSPQLDSNRNRFAILNRVVDNAFYCNLDNKDMLREVTVKIRLERIDTQEEITIEVLLNSRAIELVISSKFARKQRFRLKKIKNLYI